ncbi:MAG: prepilin-type N-terminal cleavage/methylation domain-containing protein [Candidatus Pacebacteria bacterium]|nr:prepilin-type N-terminal cleavage/methylation domain-containing protein [Candidatus Paceibacterota bacterium]
MSFLKTKNLKLKTNTGFTLIETLVAISILLIAIISPLVLAKQGMVSARLAKNQLVAFYLAQEAVEYIRNVRDTNLLSEANWLSYLGDCQSGLCYIDAQEPVFSSAINSCGIECPELNKYYPDVNQENFLYSYESGSPSGFVRNIRIEDVPNNSDEVSVEVEIIWDRGQRTFSVRESLFNLR